MSTVNSIEKTFQILANTRAQGAVPVLVHALSVDDQSIRDNAARSLLASGSSLGKLELIRHIDRLSPDVVQELQQTEDAFSFPLQQSLMHGDIEMAKAALDTIEKMRMYAEIRTLLDYFESPSGELVERCQQVLMTLVNDVYHGCVECRETQQAVAEQRAEELLEVLGNRLHDFDKLKRPRPLILAALILANPTHGVARLLIRESNEDCRSIVWDLLSTAIHPGLFEFLTRSLRIKYIHPRLIGIIRDRSDPEFQYHMIRSVPERPNPNQERNYHQIGTLPWLIPDRELWDTVPETWQGNVIRLVNLLPFERPEKLQFYRTALKYGSVEARNAVIEHRQLLDVDEFEEFLEESLQSRDPRNQSWAIEKLRSSKIPDKFKILVTYLDSEHEMVRAAAQKALDYFDVAKAIEFCESARADAGPQIAELVLKINPKAIQAFQRELAHPVRTRRLRAAQAVHFMGIESQVAEGLIELSRDPDVILRRTIAEILGNLPQRNAYVALMELRRDSSQRVREVAEESLKKVEEALSDEDFIQVQTQERVE